ncbi:MAG: hypothetical protein HYY16_17085 [Planctomycetes bacterium]|nr:hypothetical protein [Planctomycetota bacterium]
MPPYMAVPQFHLSRLPLTTKVALSCFYAATFAAIAFTAFAVFAERTHWRTAEVQANFAGDERVTEETGRTFDRMHAAPSRRAIYDVVHPHSFMMPLLYFVLVHLMEMCASRRAFKMTLYLGAFASMMLAMFAPLLVWTSLSLAVVVVPAVALMLGSFALMITVPAYQMWLGGGKIKP